MAMITEDIGSPRSEVQRYRVQATGETGTGVSMKDGLFTVGRRMTIGDQVSVYVVDVCMDETGEIRTFQADRLERLPSDA